MKTSRENGGVAVDFEPMSPEEQQGTMEFLLRQQAQFAADLAKGQERVSAIEQAVIGVTGVLGRIVEVQERTTERMDQLAVRMDQLTGRIDRLTEAQSRSDDRLNIVIEMFERHLREDHGAH